MLEFTQPDPLIQDVYDPQNLNHYAYCRNNPLILTDPSGNTWENTWNSFNNWTNNTWDNFWSQSYNAWDSFSRFTYNSINTFTTYSMQAFSNFGQGMYNYGSSVWQETKIWSGALGMGMEYGINILSPPGSLQYKGLDWISRNIAEPINNTLFQPGYNYGMWTYREKNLKNLFGASLDAAWAILGVGATIKSVAAASAPYWQYYPEGNLGYKSPYLVRSWQPPYQPGPEAYKEKGDVSIFIPSLAILINEKEVKSN